MPVLGYEMTCKTNRKSNTRSLLNNPMNSQPSDIFNMVKVLLVPQQHVCHFLSCFQLLLMGPLPVSLTVVSMHGTCMQHLLSTDKQI